MARITSKDTHEDQVIKRLDGITRLLALHVTSGMKTVERINYLAKAGFDRVTIAEIAGTSPDAVSVRLSEAKRKQRAKSNRPESQSAT